MGLVHNSYKYSDNLLALEASSGSMSCDMSQPVQGFLPLPSWEPFLATHPDQRLAAFLRRGISAGFRIGFDRRVELSKSSANLQSVRSNPRVVSDYIANEVAQGKLKVVQGPLEHSIHTSPIGLVPKSSQPGKFRLIIDLSSPPGHSVNDGVDPSLSSLSYATVGHAVALCRSFGPGALMAKLDLKSAYRMVPIHPLDQHLLGIEWEGRTYVDQALPFGLRSAPVIFTAVADGLAWAMKCRGINSQLHYLDDFFFCGGASSLDCANSLSVALETCTELGLPVAPAKVEGPSTVITFLGIEIDSIRQEIRLPQVKLTQLLAILSSWTGRHNATKRQLQSLIGKLNHAAGVVRPGRTFTRLLIDTMKIPNRKGQRVRLNAECKSDIQWWSLFLQCWNGISYFPGCRTGVSMLSDAAGHWGCGAFKEGDMEWFQLRWPESWSGVSIAPKERFPIVVAAAIWGRAWSKTRVTFRCDNWAVVAALTSRSVRDPSLMHLLRCLFFFEAYYNLSMLHTILLG